MELILLLFSAEISLLPNAAVYFTMSNGESVVPGFPPIVPLIPEMLLINATGEIFRYAKLQKKGCFGD